MLLSITCSLALLFATPALSSQLERRSFYAGGGFGLSAASGSCPPGTAAAACAPCCPTGFSVQETCATGALTSACCPKGSSCAEALQATPFCADPSWVLWNTTAGDYLCCLQNQIGTNKLECVSDLTVVAASLSASKIGQPAPTGPAASLVGPSSSGTATGSGTAKTTAAATTTGGGKSGTTATVIQTTTKNGIASIITSLIADATGKSEANTVRTLGHDGGHLRHLGFTAVIGSVLGFGLIAARLV